MTIGAGRLEAGRTVRGLEIGDLDPPAPAVELDEPGRAQDVLDLGAVAAGVHEDRAADGRREPGERFEPGETGGRRLPRHEGERRTGTGAHPQAADADALQPAAQPRHDARQPGVGDEHVRAEAEELERQVQAGDPGQQADQGALRGHLHETLGRAADPQGGEARQRLPRLDHQARDSPPASGPFRPFCQTEPPDSVLSLTERRSIRRFLDRQPPGSIGAEMRRRNGVTTTTATSEGEHPMAVDPKVEKGKAVEGALTQIERQFGKGSIMRLGAREIQPIDFIPTGSLAIDAAIGIGGFPRGRVVEVFGPESSGKTTLALSVIGQAQKRGGVAAFIDAEHALDAEYAKKLGVDIDNLLVSQPDNGEQALEIAEMLVRSNAVDIVVIDSVAALVPRAELEGEMGDSHVGLQARLMSQALRKLTAIVAKSNTCMVFINQIREKIGVMFGNPETTTGGRALKFYSSIRVDIRRISAIKEGEIVTGSRAKVKIVKNKVAAPFRQAEFDIDYGEGISRPGELVDMGVEQKLVQKSGAWFNYGDIRLGQGRENSKQFLRDNPELANELEAKLRVALSLPPMKAAEEAAVAK